MSTTSPEADRDVDALAERLPSAGFVRVVTRADGDGVAAAGVLARALSTVDIPVQVTAARTDEGRARRADRAADHAAPGDVTVVVGTPDASGADPAVLAGDGRPDSVAAWELARSIAGNASPGDLPRPSVLALAGAVAAGAVPGEDGTDAPLSAAREAGVERRPGVAIPTGDATDLAHSTLVHAPFSGDPGAAGEALSGLFDPAGFDHADPDVGRDLASLVALRVAGDDEAARSAGVAVERALRPYAVPDGPVATVGGLADVLDAAARESPGVAVALSRGYDAREAALSAWREHARAAHGAVRSATTARYDGVLVARVDSGPVDTTARLLSAYRSPEPVALVVGDGEAAAALSPDAEGGDLPATLRTAARGIDPGAETGGTARRARARFDDLPDRSALVGAFREALP
ncbi:exonuclease [Halobacteriales archaeon QS_8_69_26]|nr:MAG: exonuclease [Halobacteriales archaeon QS_8_69_26]